MSILTDAREEQLLLLDEARRIVRGGSRMLATNKMLAAAIAAIDTQAQQLVDADGVLDSLDADLAAARDQLATATEEAARQAAYIARLETTDSRNKQEIAALRDQIAAAARALEALYKITNADLNRSAVAHHAVLRLRAALLPEPTRSTTPPLPEETRLVAGGA